MGLPLSKRQKEVLSLVNKHIDKNGYSPSLTELMEDLGLSTKRGVAFHLDALEKKGYITRTGKARGIRLSNKATGDNFMSVPVLGFANAGDPLLLAQEEDNGELVVDKSLLKGKRRVFGLELRGDSMNQKTLNGINLDNGNFVIIAKDEEVREGDAVLAIVENAATIKSFKKEGNMIVLYPESSNPVHKPIYVKNPDSGFIAGKVLTVLTNPS